MITSLLVGAALLLLFSPPLLKAGASMLSVPSIQRQPQVGYQKAMADLASVRKRLANTKTLDDATRKAIDVITLALVAGSDQ